MPLLCFSVMHKAEKRGLRPFDAGRVHFYLFRLCCACADCCTCPVYGVRAAGVRLPLSLLWCPYERTQSGCKDTLAGGNGTAASVSSPFGVICLLFPYL